MASSDNTDDIDAKSGDTTSPRPSKAGGKRRRNTPFKWSELLEDIFQHAVTDLGGLENPKCTPRRILDKMEGSPMMPSAIHLTTNTVKSHLQSHRSKTKAAAASNGCRQTPDATVNTQNTSYNQTQYIQPNNAGTTPETQLVALPTGGMDIDLTGMVFQIALQQQYLSNMLSSAVQQLNAIDSRLNAMSQLSSVSMPDSANQSLMPVENIVNAAADGATSQQPPRDLSLELPVGIFLNDDSCFLKLLEDFDPSKF